jgi:hypothetical protein
MPYSKCDDGAAGSVVSARTESVQIAIRSIVEKAEKSERSATKTCSACSKTTWCDLRSIGFHRDWSMCSVDGCVCYRCSGCLVSPGLISRIQLKSRPVSCSTVITIPSIPKPVLVSSPRAFATGGRVDDVLAMLRKWYLHSHRLSQGLMFGFWTNAIYSWKTRRQDWSSTIIVRGTSTISESSSIAAVETSRQLEPRLEF